MNLNLNSQSNISQLNLNNSVSNTSFSNTNQGNHSNANLMNQTHVSLNMDRLISHNNRNKLKPNVFDDQSLIQTLKRDRLREEPVYRHNLHHSKTVSVKSQDLMVTDFSTVIPQSVPRNNQNS